MNLLTYAMIFPSTSTYMPRKHRVKSDWNPSGKADLATVSMSAWCAPCLPGQVAWLR
jgi:hypothetical protein